jgi:hypothetical protein
MFRHPSFHPQEDLYMQFYGISFMHPYKQSGRWKDVLETLSYSTFLTITVQLLLTHAVLIMERVVTREQIL